MKVHHIGYLVKSIPLSSEKFDKMGYHIETSTIHDESRNIDICFMKNGETRIELIQPHGMESAVGKLYKKIRNSPYHICYEVQNLDQSIQLLLQDGFVLFQEPTLAVAMKNKKVAFLVDTEVGLIELIENL